MPPTPIPARKATVGLVYLSPKGRELRVEKIGSADVTVFRLATSDTIQIDAEYLLTPREDAAPAAVTVATVIPPHVDAVAGRGRDVLQPWIHGETPPAPSDADLDALLAVDTRSWVAFEVKLERERRDLAATAAAVVPVAAAVAEALGGEVVDVSPTFPAVVASDAPAEPAPAITVVAQGVVDVEEIPLTPDPAPVAAEAFVSETSPAPASDEGSAIGGHPVATEPADDLLWSDPEADDRPLVLPGEPAAVPVAVEPASADVTPTAEPIVEPVATPAPEPTVEPAADPKPAKERPKGYCPACAQHLTVRAEGGMMQHFTPDGRKGPDGKRVTCQGVGLAPRSEPTPIERLTLPEAMGIGSTSEAAPATEAPDAVADRVEASMAANGVRDEVRYTIGGSDEAGWCIIDLRTQRALTYMEPDGDTTPALFATESEAREVLVYVREHGELPDGEADLYACQNGPDEDAETARIVAKEARDGETMAALFADELRQLQEARERANAAKAVRRQEERDREAHEERVQAEIERAQAVADSLTARFVQGAPVTNVVNNATDPIAALTRMVEDAKARGVRVRIIIEPIE